jgi:hypothetical protein
MRHTWLAAAALVVVGACGGKTQSGGEGGNAGSGAVAGSGATGFGGASSGGASSGGSSFGGASTGGGGNVGGGGSGGVGALGGGGSGTGGASSIDQKIDEICKKMSQLPCGTFDCQNELHEAVAEATSAGCFAQLDDVFDCALAHPLICDGGDDGPSLSPQCDGVRDDLTQCFQGTGECASFGGGNGCGMSCSGPDSWGVKCTSSPAGLDCVCTDGPNAGLSAVVSVSCNSPAWQETVANLCS